LLTITLRPQHCNQIQHELQQHKGKEKNQKDAHITIVTDPTKLM
jgi:hypothetical protein